LKGYSVREIRITGRNTRNWIIAMHGSGLGELIHGVGAESDSAESLL
jgi:hypothetical protein